MFSKNEGAGEDPGVQKLDKKQEEQQAKILG